MARRLSFKQRLLAKLESTPQHRELYEAHIRLIKNRGSGPLPGWLVSLGRDLGVE